MVLGRMVSGKIRRGGLGGQPAAEISGKMMPMRESRFDFAGRKTKIRGPSRWGPPWHHAGSVFVRVASPTVHQFFWGESRQV
jgi:hypothetical protein